jgi:hypothetical protein
MIRNWKDLDLCRPDRDSRYDHIDSLFSETVNWSLIETYFPDMLRVALSIKAGRISASTILRRLGTYSRKNRLYQAFSELGRVLRTGFLLRYISDQQLFHGEERLDNFELLHGFSPLLLWHRDKIRRCPRGTCGVVRLRFVHWNAFEPALARFPRNHRIQTCVI